MAKNTNERGDSKLIITNMDPNNSEDFDKNFEEILFRIPDLQDKIKRDKTVYREEFEKILAFFKLKFEFFLTNPSKRVKGMKEMFMFFAQVGHISPSEIAFIPVSLISLIENNYTVINPEIRQSIVESLSLLRKKELLDTLEILPLFFKLLRCQDKILRRRLQDIIVSDLSKINQNHKNNHINKSLQNFCINNMLNDPNKKASRKTLNIMISLYKKKLWNDSKTVNALAITCASSDPKICYASCQFFLSEYEEAEADSSDDEELDELKSRYKLLGKSHNKKTKTKKNKLNLLMKSIDRREKRRSKVTISKDFMPIDILNDPSDFAQKLFSKLKNMKENFKLKLALLRLIGRVVGRHRLYINNYYSYLLSYLTPNQSEINVILASIIESCHDNIPPVELEPLMNKLFNNFISESLSGPVITVGLNTAKEIIERAPYVLKPEYINIINTLKEYKNKSVTNSARAIINCIKEINSNLLNIYDGTLEKTVYYGQSKASDTIEGIELLKKHEKLPDDYRMEYDVILDDMQLKKMKVLRMKFSAEKIQNKKINLTSDDVNEMAGEKVKKSKKKREQPEEDLGGMADVEDMEDMEELEDIEDMEDLEDLEDIEDLEDLEDLNDQEEELEEELENDPNNQSALPQELSLHESENEESENEEEEDIYALDSDELKSVEESEDEQHPHGFIDPEQINTYRKKFNEKKDLVKNEEKEKYVHSRKEKGGGQTNKEKLKNKPMMMVIPKKKRHKKLQNKLVNIGRKIRDLKQHLGRFKRGNMVLKKKGGLTRKK